MYSKQESAQLKQQFWTAFGQYMQPVLSAEGERINWINYKTGEKDIYFRMQADNKKAYIAIELTHKDAGLQALYYEQFEQMHALLSNALNEEWTWQLHTNDEQGKCISRIYTELYKVSIFKREDWPLLISFFKPRITALDEFWSTAKHVFETLR
ncbi:DUF4268 domain-containing protein [Parafilimonas terrae]|jgi:hypothetical protein|uniref:DUF4268 domain-containing protein n=1 Tax=Parafilimonas terrae TaxID=1465490 RepID=A0A1I5YJ52_9BACT|nr:DUF4268 domain-containing protein [Parafilimonas terrae]SFQ44175.1 protein of unknown function [Parafilimonas terrae]